MGACLKHFAANSQEKARLASNSVVDPRALREIYLAGFEEAVRTASPETIMCSCNMVNGTCACENKLLLSDILRDDWGFDGFVMTGWGAMDERVAAVEAGLELEMPGPCSVNAAELVEAVKAGKLDEAVLDRACERLLRVVLAHQDAETGPKPDFDGQRAIAREVAAGSCVLLSNKGGLPVAPGTKVAVIGAFAKEPRIQGGGSSHINSVKVECPYDELVNAGLICSYAPGYDAATGDTTEALVAEAVAAAKEAGRALVFAGLPSIMESEGYDRSALSLPQSHNRLIKALAESGVPVSVVLFCGSPVVMPWRGDVDAILLAYLGDGAAGGAPSPTWSRGR